MIIPQAKANKNRIGKLVHRFPEGWKISALAEINNEPVVMAYSNVTRCDSQIWTKDGQIPLSPEAASAETIGQPITWGSFNIAAGECGYLVFSWCGGPPQHKFKLDWASTCCVYRGKPIVIDQRDDGKNYVRNCNTPNGDVLFEMPGRYIALDSCEYNGKLYAAVGWDQGLSCSDGTLIPAKMCHCCLVHRGELIFTSGNKVLKLAGPGAVACGELPCEKIMHVISIDDRILRFACANPDSVYDYDSNTGELAHLGTVADMPVEEVGGQCFGWRVSRNYFARTRRGPGKAENGRDLDMGEVWEIRQ